MEPPDVRTPAPRRASLVRATTAATTAAIAAYAGTLVQQVLYGRVLGVGSDTDALAAALAWAVATTGLIGTVMASVLVPRYVRASGTDDAAAATVFQTGTALAFGVAIAVAAGSALTAPALAAFLLPGADQAARSHLADLLRLTSPLHVIWVVVWLAVALSNARERYILASGSPLLAVSPVIGVLALRPHVTVDEVAAAYVVGAAVQGIVLIALVRDHVRALLPRLDRAVLQPIARPLALITAAFVLFNATGLLVRIVASLGDPGDVAIADYALRLIGVVEQVVLAGALAVLLTRWSPDRMADAEAILPVLAIAVSVALAVGAGIAVAAPELVGLLFQSPRFDEGSVALTAGFVRWAAPGMVGHMFLMVALRATLARHQSGQVLLVGGVTLAAMALTVAGAYGAMGLDGVALGYSAGWIAGAVVIVATLFYGQPAVRTIARETSLSLLVVTVASLPAVVALSAVPGVVPLRLAASAAAFCLIAFPLAGLLDLTIAREARDLISRRSSAW